MGNKPFDFSLFFLSSFPTALDPSNQNLHDLGHRGHPGWVQGKVDQSDGAPRVEKCTWQPAPLQGARGHPRREKHVSHKTATEKHISGPMEEDSAWCGHDHQLPFVFIPLLSHFPAQPSCSRAAPNSWLLIRPSPAEALVSVSS